MNDEKRKKIAAMCDRLAELHAEGVLAQKSPDAQNAERWTPGLLRLEALESRVADLDQSQARRLAAIETFLWAESGYNPAYRSEGAVETVEGASETGVPNTTPTWTEILRGGTMGAAPKAETVAPAPRATGRAGEGVRELSREEQVAILYPDGSKSRALAQAKDLHAYCDRNGYEGIGHSIGLLVAELERQA